MSIDVRNKALAQLIRPLPQANYEVHVFVGRIAPFLEGLGNDYGGLEMCPDFQRGHVWTEAQQIAFLEALLRGALPSSSLLLQFNCRNFNDFRDSPADLPTGLQCLDGLQRYTAAQRLIKGEIKPFGLSLDDLAGTNFDPNRDTFRFRVAIFAFRSRAEVLSHYLALNGGGTPHSPEEIQRVKQLLAEAMAAQ